MGTKRARQCPGHIPHDFKWFQQPPARFILALIADIQWNLSVEAPAGIFNRIQPSTTLISVVWGIRIRFICISPPRSMLSESRKCFSLCFSGGPRNPPKKPYFTRSITFSHKVREISADMKCSHVLQTISSSSNRNKWVLCCKVMMKGHCEGNEGRKMTLRRSDHG